ncbi:SET domain-containing protein, partial [Acephala macrosclerotiorum]
LKHQKKKVVVRDSTINGLGLFAGEFIKQGNIIIEYAGEEISEEENTIREARDKEQGKVLSYRFRIDRRTVIDADGAERKGNESRYINHSCRPNSKVRVCRLNGRRHLIFYALRNIAVEEEITFDYKFELEIDSSDRIKCRCGTKDCRGFLN